MTTKQVRALGYWCMCGVAAALVMMLFVPELGLVVMALASGLGLAAFRSRAHAWDKEPVPAQPPEDSKTR